MQTSSPKKVLFISHEASRSGAPIVLLHLLKWIKTNTALKFDVLLLEDGPLRTDFEGLGKTYIASAIFNEYSKTNRLKKKLFKGSPSKLKKVTDKLAKNKYHLVYGNTIVSLPWLNAFKSDYQLKTICCIHELSYALNYFFTDHYLKENLALTDSIIAVSNAVKDNLVNSYHLPPEKIKLHYEFINTDDLSVNHNLNRETLGITANEFIIGTAGTASWRKGTDLLIPLILNLLKNYPHFKFKVVWLGASEKDGFVKQLIYDADKLGISHQLLFIDSQPDPHNYINLFDVFVLLSREDPFPLIVLEAAFLKKPVIAFDGSGGAPELIAKGAGLLALYLDIANMANLIYTLSKDSQQLVKLGSKGYELVMSGHTASAVAHQIYLEISQAED